MGACNGEEFAPKSSNEDGITANDAYMREYSIAIPKDCTASNNDEDNDFALTMMENVLFAEITTEKQITAEK